MRPRFGALLAIIFWGMSFVATKAALREVSPVTIITVRFVIGAVMLLPFFVARAGWRELPHLTSIGWLSILFLGVGCSALGYLFWYGALEKVEVSRVAALLYLEPLVTFATAVALLHESVSFATVAGGVLVLASVLATQYAPAIQQNGAAAVTE